MDISNFLAGLFGGWFSTETVETSTIVEEQPESLELKSKNQISDPLLFSDFVGNNTVVENLELSIKAAQKENRVLPHILLYGQPGLGKTTLAKIIAKETNQHLVEITGSTIKNQSDLFKILIELDKTNGMLFIDECLKKDSLIVLADGGIKKIQEINNERLYIGEKVENKLNRVTHKMLNIVTGDGYLTTTLTHPHYALKKEYFYHYKSKRRIDNIKIVKANELKVGDYLLTPKFIPHTTKKKWTKEQLAFIALVIADGCFSIQKYIKHETKEGIKTIVGNYIYDYAYLQFSFRKKWKYNKAKEIIEKAINSFKIKPTSVKFSIGRDYVIRIYGKEFCKYIGKTFDILSGEKKKYNTVINNEIFYSSLKAIKEFINIILLFEGWEVIKRDKKHKYILMSSELFLKQFQLLLKKFGVFSKMHIVKYKNKINSYFRLTIKTIKRKEFKIFKNKYEFCFSKIEKINLINRTEKVYDFTTQSHFFMVDGYLTHNCHDVTKSKELPDTSWLPLLQNFTFFHNLQDKTIMHDNTTYTISSNKAVMKPFTIIGATTDPGDLTDAFRERFPITCVLYPYTNKDIQDIISLHSDIRKIRIDKEAIKSLSTRVRDNPRIAINYLRNCNDRAIVENDYVIDEKVVTKQMKSQGINDDGINRDDIAVLKVLADHPKGLGVKSLAGTANVRKSTVEDIIEPWLKRKGLMETTSRRFITIKGREYLENKEVL